MSVNKVIKNYKGIIKEVKKIVKHRLNKESSGHDFWHCQRVVNLALKIGKKEKANLIVLELAGWLHDLGATVGRKNHEIRSAKQAKIILDRLKINPKITDRVIACIKNHRFTTGKVETLEDTVLRDADKLDIIGAIGVARLFQFAGKYNRPIHDGKIAPNIERYKTTGRSRTMMEHVYEKIFLLPNLLQTKTARKIGRNRFAFCQIYLKRFFEEWEGKL